MTSSIDIKDIQTPLIPQELWLIEAYIKPAYWLKMVTAWERMIEISEVALEDYMAHIPSNYRSRHVSEQPDVVWGGRVLPNFKSGDMRGDYTRLLHGDYDLQTSAGGIFSDIRGASDYDHDWLKDRGLNGRMGFDVYAEFYKQQEIARLYANNIAPTFGFLWLLGSLTESKLYDMGSGYGIRLPTEWPTYRLNPLFQCATDEPVPKSGIYIPAAPRSCANFLALIVDNPNATPARVGGRNPITGDLSDDYGQVDTIWTLVERVSDTGGGPVQCRIVPENEYYSNSTERQSLPGEPNSVCPRSGTWQTPAMLSPRSIKMQAGEKFPAIEHDTGGNAVVWFWVSE